MLRKIEPSFGLKQIIWDIAASVGTTNYSAIFREVDERLRQAHKKEELYQDELPDGRTIRRIVETDINLLTPEVVLAKLPQHIWRLRKDYSELLLLDKKSPEVDLLKSHFAELSEIGSALAKNLEQFLNMSNKDYIFFESEVGEVIYGGSIVPTELWEHLQEKYTIKMQNIPIHLALDLLSHIRDDFPELANISDWKHLTNQELTYDLVAKLQRIGKRGLIKGKCEHCPGLVNPKRDY